MSNAPNEALLQVETTCGSLLYELQIIWDEVGESDVERDKMLLELERECLEVYRRKVDLANKSRARLRQAIADSEAELAAICSAMGDRPVHIRQSNESPGSLKAELRAILPELEEMKKRKIDRKNKFLEVLEQIQKIQMEIYSTSSNTVLDETDLSFRKLEELHTQLEALQKEKNDRIKQVLDHLSTLNSLCLVLGIEFNQTIYEVHPNLAESNGAKSISNDIIGSLAAAIQRLREVKVQRMQRIQDLGTSLLELWNLMDTPVEEQQMFQSVTCNIAASEEEITEAKLLSFEFINYVEAEVLRLEDVKSSKMKELVFKKRSELEEICRKTHLLLVSDSSVEIALEAIESGAIESGKILEQIELQIGKVKEEALSRKEILEKVEKWMAACEEECWLEEYNRDENRYNAGRGAHLTLKRAEKARALVNKLPGIVEALAVKALSWENERGIEFTYDGIRLLSMLEEYKILRQDKEDERKRQRDQKKLQGQLIAEQEALFGSKPSPMKQQSAKKGPRMSCGGASAATNRRLSLGGSSHATPKTTPNTCQTKKNERLSNNRDDGFAALSSASNRRLSLGGSSHATPKTTPNTCQTKKNRDDGFAALSTGRRGLDIAGLPASRKHSFSEIEPSQPTFRKPFSPISSSESSKSNTLEEVNKKRDLLQKTFQNDNSNNPTFATPLKTKTLVSECENTTPKTNMIPIIPSTPSTVSVPMQTMMTPALDHQIKEMIGEEIIEYSFEERRAGFVLPTAHLNTVIKV